MDWARGRSAARTKHLAICPNNHPRIVARLCFAVERVRHRVQAGGHDVPETKIRQRHRRMWALVANAIALSDITTVYDNSRLRSPRIVAHLSGGDIVGSPDWPEWAPEAMRSRWPK